MEAHEQDRDETGSDAAKRAGDGVLVRHMGESMTCYRLVRYNLIAFTGDPQPATELN